MQRSQSPALTGLLISDLRTPLAVAPTCAKDLTSDGVKRSETETPVDGSDHLVTSRSAYRLFPDLISETPSQRPSTPTLRTGNAAAKPLAAHARRSLSLDEPQHEKMLPTPGKRRRSTDRLHVAPLAKSQPSNSLTSGPQQSSRDLYQPETSEESRHERSVAAPEKSVPPTQPQQFTKTSIPSDTPPGEQLSRVQQVQRLLARSANEQNSPPKHVVTPGKLQQIQLDRPSNPGNLSSGPPLRTQPRPIGPGMQNSTRSQSPYRRQDSPASASSYRDPAGLGISFGSNTTTPDIAMFPVPGQTRSQSPGQYAVPRSQSPGQYTVPRPRSPHGYTTSRPHSPYGGSMLRPSSPQRQYGIRPGSPHLNSGPTQSPRSQNQSSRIEHAESSFYSPPGLSAKRNIDPNLRVDIEVSKPQKLAHVSAQRQTDSTRRPAANRTQPSPQDKKAIRKSRLQKPLPATPPIEALMPPAPPAELSDSSSWQESPIQAPSPISPISPVSLLERLANSEHGDEPLGSPVSAMTNIDSDVPPQIPPDAPTVPPIPKTITRKPIAKVTPASSAVNTPITPPSSRYQTRNISPRHELGNVPPVSRASPKIDTTHLHGGAVHSLEPSPNPSVSPQPSLSPGQVEEAQSVAFQPVVRPAIEQGSQNRNESMAPSLITMPDRQSDQRKRHEKLSTLNITESSSVPPRTDPMSARSAGGHSKAASVISVPSIFAAHERPESGSPIAQKGVPRPDSDAMGTTPVLHSEQPKLSDIQNELKQEDARRQAEIALSASHGHDDGSSVKSDQKSIHGSMTSNSRPTLDTQPKSASPRRAEFDTSLTGSPRPPRIDSQLKTPSPRRLEFDPRDTAIPRASWTVRSADAIPPKWASREQDTSKKVEDTTELPTDAQATRKETTSKLSLESVTQAIISQPKRPSLETKSDSAPQLGQPNVPAALLPPARPQQAPTRSNTLPQDLAFPKQDILLGQPQANKVPSYKSFFMQANEAADTDPVVFDFPAPRLSTSSTPVTRDFAVGRTSTSSDRPYASSLRSVKTMPALAETAIEHRKHDSPIPALPTMPRQDKPKQSEESTRSRPNRFDQKRESKDETRALAFAREQRRYSPGLTGNPVNLEDAAVQSGTTQRPQTSGSDVSVATKSSVERSEQPPASKYTAYNRTTARDPPAKNSPLSVVNRMDSIRDIPPELSRATTGDSTPIARIVEDELNLPIQKSLENHPGKENTERLFSPQVATSRSESSSQTLTPVQTRVAPVNTERPSTSASDGRSLKTEPGRSIGASEQRPATSGNDRKKRTGPSLSLMPPLQVVRSIETTPKDNNSTTQTNQPVRSRPDSQLPPPVPRKDTIRNGLKRILNPKATAARAGSTSSIQSDPSILETSTVDRTVATETTSSHTSMASTTTTKTESVATSNAELARQLSEASVDSTSIEAIRARVAGISQRTAKAVQPPEQDEKALLATLEDLAKQSEAMHERYAGLRVERQKLSSSITQTLKENKAGPEYANTLLDKHMALSAITSSLDICFAKLKSLDCRKEEAIAALVKQMNKKTAAAATKNKTASAKSVDKITSAKPVDKTASAKPVDKSATKPRSTSKENSLAKPTIASNEQKTLIALTGSTTKVEDTSARESSSSSSRSSTTGRGQVAGRVSPPRPQIEVVPEEDIDDTYQSPKARVNATRVIKRAATPDNEAALEKVITLPGKTGASDLNSRLVVTIGAAKQSKTPPPQRPLPAAPPAKRKSPVDSIHASVLSVASTPEDQDALTPKEESSPNPLKTTHAGRDVRVYAEDDFLDYYRSAPD